MLRIEDASGAARAPADEEPRDDHEDDLRLAELQKWRWLDGEDPRYGGFGGLS